MTRTSNGIFLVSVTAVALLGLSACGGAKDHAAEGRGKAQVTAAAAADNDAVGETVTVDVCADSEASVTFTGAQGFVLGKNIGDRVVDAGDGSGTFTYKMPPAGHDAQGEDCDRVRAIIHTQVTVTAPADGGQSSTFTVPGINPDGTAHDLVITSTGTQPDQTTTTSSETNVPTGN